MCYNCFISLMYIEYHQLCSIKTQIFYYCFLKTDSSCYIMIFMNKQRWILDWFERPNSYSI